MENTNKKLNKYKYNNTAECFASFESFSDECRKYNSVSLKNTFVKKKL